MGKILLKALILFLIVLSVYFIVHPQACSNMLAGRQTTVPSEGADATWTNPMAEPQPNITDKAKEDWQVREELFTSQEDSKKQGDSAETLKAIQPNYSQEDMDYAVASRYVELERDLAKTHPLGKDSSSELSYAVMEEFGMKPAEWNSFLTRATASNLFEKARQDLPLDTASSSTTVTSK